MEDFFRTCCNDQDYLDFLQELVNSDRIDGGAALGVTKMVIDGRCDELSQPQWNTFLKHVAELNYVDGCTRCATPIPWCEMLEALDNGGYCNYCVHKMEKGE